MSACEDLKHLYVTRHRVCKKLHSGQWRRQGGGRKLSPLWVDVQKLCNMCVLSLSWNFFVTHDKYIARRSSKEPRWYTDNTTGTGGTSYSKPPIDPYLTSPPVTKSWRRHWFRSKFLLYVSWQRWHCSHLLLSSGRAAIGWYLVATWPTPGNPPFFATNSLFNCRISCGVLLLTFMHVITSSIPSPPHSFVVGLQPFFLQILPTVAFLLLSSGLTPRIPRTVYRYVWA